MAEGGADSIVCVVGVSAHVGLMCLNVSVSLTELANFISFFFHSSLEAARSIKELVLTPGCRSRNDHPIALE